MLLFAVFIHIPMAHVTYAKLYMHAPCVPEAPRLLLAVTLTAKRNLLLGVS